MEGQNGVKQLGYEAALHKATVLRFGSIERKRLIGACGRGLCLATIDDTKSRDIESQLLLRPPSKTISLFSQSSW
jgi:hypothetical protein